MPWPRPRAPDEFPVVGLGASAGGLEAFEQFFRSVPADLGMAFVLVSHLDPSHESILTEILQRATSLPVVEASDQLAVKPDHIYVIPPNRDMTIFHGVLQLSVPEAPRGQRMPIDAFFRSLAEDRGDRAMGVVLSGTGSDGTLGLRAIAGEGGVTFVQDPATATYDGMPSSAIRSGFATHVLPVERMPEAMRIAARAPGVRRPRPVTPSSEQGLIQVLATLRSRTGHDFSQYKRSTVVRRVDRRMAQHDIPDVGVYARFLKEHPAEVQLLFRELLINVTSFFRDREAFEALRKALPALFAGQAGGLGLPRLDRRMRHRRGGLLRRHPRPGADGGGPPRLQGADLRDRSRRRGHRRRARRDLSTEHRPGRHAGAAAPVLREGGGGLPGQEGDPRDGGLRGPGRDPGSALHPARPALLPQPHDLPGAGAPGAAALELPLRPAPRRPPAPVSLGEHRPRRRSVQAARPQVEAVPRRPVTDLRPAPSRGPPRRAPTSPGRRKGPRPPPGRRRSRRSPSSPPGRSSRPSRRPRS